MVEIRTTVAGDKCLSADTEAKESTALETLRGALNSFRDEVRLDRMTGKHSGNLSDEKKRIDRMSGKPSDNPSAQDALKDVTKPKPGEAQRPADNKSSDRQTARGEYQNGMASQDLVPIEQLVDKSKQSGAINQEQLESELEKFAKKTDTMWHQKEDRDLDAVSKDQYLTIPRFYKLFDILDDAHRDNLLKTLPWSLRPGE